jgi:hypothetical protein
MQRDRTKQAILIAALWIAVALIVLLALHR